MPAGFNDKAVEIIMLWFKNLMVYRLSRDVSLRAEEMEKQLASMTFTPCGSQDMAKMGWVPPMGSHSDALTHTANGQIIICARKEEKFCRRRLSNRRWKPKYSNWKLSKVANSRRPKKTH
jgi:recombination associated protein RdgC